MNNVLIAAAAAWIFGAIWYGMLSGPWMAASGKSPEDMQGSSKLPYIISLISVVLVAGMMRHIFAMAGIDGLQKGFVTGLGLGLFIVSPWIVLHYSFSGRPVKLMAIDGGYATIGCTIMRLM